MIKQSGFKYYITYTVNEHDGYDNVESFGTEVQLLNFLKGLELFSFNVMYGCPVKLVPKELVVAWKVEE